MILNYPVILTKEDDSYLVNVPDLNIDTFGNTFDEAMNMAYDAIGMVYMSREDNKLKINKPSKIETFIKNAKYKKDIVTHISIDPVQFRKKNDNKYVRRNITLPSWLDNLAR